MSHGREDTQRKCPKISENETKEEDDDDDGANRTMGVSEGVWCGDLDRRKSGEMGTLKSH